MPAGVDSKPLTCTLSPLDATLLKIGGGGCSLGLARQRAHGLTINNSLTIKNIAENPASSTPLSSETEIRCNLLNSTSNGLSAAVAWIDPICTRSAAIFGLTACCDTTVSPIISKTHNAAGVAKLANDLVRATRASRITIPQTTPIMCIHHNANPTIAPAWSRLAKIRNAPGATTKLRNASLPSHRLNPRNSSARSKLNMNALYKTAPVPATAANSNWPT